MNDSSMLIFHSYCWLADIGSFFRRKRARMQFVVLINVFCTNVVFLSGPEHVPKYHEWMKDPSLLEATGSEPLSFEEELEMQQSWRDDPNKCTFIVHATKACTILSNTGELDTTMTSISVQQELPGMVGDVNLFLSEIDDEEEADEDTAFGIISTKSTSTSTQEANTAPRIQAEVDIMIAEKNFQKQGLGRAATCAMLLYGAKELGIQRYFCKINEGNVASMEMFKSLGFTQCDYAECFKQYEFELIRSLGELKAILEPYGAYTEVACPL